MYDDHEAVKPFRKLSLDSKVKRTKYKRKVVHLSEPIELRTPRILRIPDCYLERQTVKETNIQRATAVSDIFKD